MYAFQERGKRSAYKEKNEQTSNQDIFKELLCCATLMQFDYGRLRFTRIREMQGGREEDEQREKMKRGRKEVRDCFMHKGVNAKMASFC